MPVVTLSAAYGAAGSRIGPALAERLGVPFVNRVLGGEVAEHLPHDVAEDLHREQPVPGLLERLLSGLAPMGQLYGAPPPPDTAPRGLAETEEALRALAGGRGLVVLGLAGAIVLADHPGALHVRLTGPREARIAQAVTVDAVDEATARRRVGPVDSAREGYVRQFYGADAADPEHYHLVLDATRLDQEACVELVLRAARAVDGRG